MKIDYLRLSITNRCNLKCIYCHPLSDMALKRCKDFLSINEILHIARLLTQCGITKFRLTGGEPLLRNDIIQIVNELSILEGIEDLSVTTNGIYLESLAKELKNAGLRRVNISVDSLNKDTYKKITEFDQLPKVIRGIYKAIEIGLEPVKINTVILKDVNSSKEEINSLARMSIDLPVAVRFVEYYATSKDISSNRAFVPNSEIRKVIEQEFGKLENPALVKGYGPAKYFKIKNSLGAIGFINGRSSMFCHECNRLRLTSDGKLKSCLYSEPQYDLKELLRSGMDDENIIKLLKKIILNKNHYTKINTTLNEFSMQSIGG